MLAIQFHPERMFASPQSPISKTTRDAFIAVTKNSLAEGKKDIIDQHFLDPA